jgi:NitT/TauT family transport system ATP-binding protein
MTALIEVTRIGKTYSHPDRPVRALDGISFSVLEGQFVSIVGSSGCGKSTLLQILAGLCSSTEGEVRIDGEKVVRPLPEKIAVVFQDPLLLPWRTALGNVELPLELRGVDKQLRRQRSLQFLELVGLTGFTDRHPHELSGGMRQRVAIARGLVQNPRIVMMDEPFGALDEQTRTQMGDELLRIWHATQKTVLFITHSLIEAVYLSDVVRVMGRNPGRIIDEVVIDLPRPRTIEMIGSASFGLMRNHIWRLIGADVESAVKC